MSDKFELIAKTHQGLEGVLAEELRLIGAEEITISPKSVSFKGDKEMMYKANIQLRTALRILKPIYTFKARTEDEFYGQAKKYDWLSVMDISQKYAVDSIINSEVFNHSRYIALKLKDAIADHFREKVGKRPFVDPQNPQIKVHVNVVDEECTICLDSSGESLNKRGYRSGQDSSSINEVLAAGMVLLSGWNGDSDFIDPMCGSGTILIEAGLIAHGIPPGIFRKHFGFENWFDFDEALLQQVYNDDSMEREFNHSIIGSDISQRAVEISTENVRNAGLHKKVDIKFESIYDFTPPKGKGVVITNPPFGEKLKKEQIESFYKQLGDCFKQRFTGFDVWIISSNTEALRSFGLRPETSLSLINGGLECKYYHYPMYKGAPKDKSRKPKA